MDSRLFLLGGGETPPEDPKAGQIAVDQELSRWDIAIELSPAYLAE